MRERKATQRQRNPVTSMLKDCRSSDRKKGLEGNDLDRDFAEDLIRSGCHYCGDTQGRMTLDRIDNTKAHNRENVVASCLRCNYMRGSMPYKAWLHLVPTVREAHELGLFGDWQTVPFRLRHKISGQ